MYTGNSPDLTRYFWGLGSHFSHLSPARTCPRGLRVRRRSGRSRRSTMVNHTDGSQREREDDSGSVRPCGALRYVQPRIGAHTAGISGLTGLATRISCAMFDVMSDSASTDSRSWSTLSPRREYTPVVWPATAAGEEAAQPGSPGDARARRGSLQTCPCGAARCHIHSFYEGGLQ